MATMTANYGLIKPLAEDYYDIEIQNRNMDIIDKALNDNVNDIEALEVICTQESKGLMSAEDKAKLDGIEKNANKYLHPTSAGNKHIPSGGSANQFLKYSTDGTAEWTLLTKENVGLGITELSNAVLVTLLTGLSTTNNATIVATDTLLMALGKVQAQINNRAMKSSIVTTTLSAASWAGTVTPYTYTLAISGVTATSNQEVLPSTSITQEQVEALQGANIVDGGQTVNSIILKAYGTKPTIDLPIRVIKRGDA